MMEISNYFIPLLLRHLQLMDVKCDPKELQLVLQSAPSFPSVLSIVQTFTYFGLKATAYRADYAALEKTTTPVIAHTKQGSTDRFILILTVSETTVTYYDAFINRNIEIAKGDFCAIWTGIVVLSEKTENVFQNRKLNKYPEYSIALAVVCLVLLVFLNFRINASPQSLLFFFLGLFVLKSAGIWCTVGLLRQESKGSYSIFDVFCHRNEAFDCEKVIQSKASRLFNKVALADIGFVYFATGIISLFFGVFSDVATSILQSLFYLSVCSIPLILFSVFYQKIIIKKWCPLCLGVMAILVIEAALFFFFPDKVFSKHFVVTAGFFSFSLFSSLGILLLAKHTIENQAKAFNLNVSALLLKRTPFVIAATFGSQMNMSRPMKDSLTIGSAGTPVTVTTLLNPMCSPCKNMADEMIELLKSYPSFIQWHIRFDGVIAPEYDYLNKPQLYLFELFMQNDSTKVRLNIIKEWFRVQSLGKFSESYPLNAISKEIILAFSEHILNNNELKVEKVPSIWINNRFFPQEYSLNDLPFLLTDIGVLLKATK